ncbi:hypothetical protein [uncultured Aquimarina sp.]|uniref:hypothetical protein n=1 Tax=uncultured Aquimarina sp. TaxID=575652 RepID=UPI00262F9FCA|nr:hypothetical protein [uncultured Aquimarina sp.]
MIKKISLNLSIEFLDELQNQNNLIITSDGNKKLYPLIDSIINTQIKSEIFNFIALRQAIPDFKGFKLNGKELPIEKMTFVPQQMENGLFIIFIFDNESESIDREFLENYGMNTIDYLIGERKFSEEINDFEFIFTKDLETINLSGLASFPLIQLNNYLTKTKETKIKSNLESLILSGKWYIESVKLGSKERTTNKNENWILFYPNGKSEILTDGKKSFEKWSLNNDILSITIDSKQHEFKTDLINNNTIILSSFMDKNTLRIKLKNYK